LSEPSEIGTSCELSEVVVCDVSEVVVCEVSETVVGELSETAVCELSEASVCDVGELEGAGDSSSARSEIGSQTTSAKRQKRPPEQALKVLMTDDL